MGVSIFANHLRKGPPGRTVDKPSQVPASNLVFPRGGCRKEDIEMKVDTKSRHRTNAGGNVFKDLGFPPKEAKRLLAHANAQIDEYTEPIWQRRVGT